MIIWILRSNKKDKVYNENEILGMYSTEEKIRIERAKLEATGHNCYITKLELDRTFPELI